MNKPIKCWDCLRLGDCQNICKNGCKKFIKWRFSFNEVAKKCNVTTNSLYSWFKIGKNYALKKIQNTCGVEYKLLVEDNRRWLQKVI